MRWRAWVCVVVLCACKKGSPPTIVDPGNRTAVVGETTTIDVFASDKDGDALAYDFRAAGVPDLESTAVMSVAPDGHGVFTLTPLASQVGQHIFDFVVSDDTFSTTLSITIDIVGASGAGSAPVFREPISEGTVLDLETAECVGFEIEIEDPDSTEVELTQEPPLIGGAQLDAAGNGLSGTWEWCPDREQKEGDDQWALGLSADDGDNPPTIKDFLVVVRKRSGEGCPMQPPAIAHDPHDFETLLDLDIVADVSDDIGLRNQPVVLYAYEDPGTPVDFATLSNVATMELVDGDMRQGTWRAFVPNPTATQGQGAQATVWYLISATDNDDVEGDCDHRTDHPVSGTHAVEVTNDGGAGAGLCEPCSFDVQCGGDDDHCLPSNDGPFCGQGCADDCPEGYTCTLDPVISTEGSSGRQCVPDLGSCDGGGGGACEDDAFEDDDTPDEGIAAGVTAEGVYEAVACPGDDDWWLIEIDDAGSARIEAVLTAGSPPDLDLALTDDTGVLIEQSIGFTSDEQVTSSCLAAGQYLLRVWSAAAGGEHAEYGLVWSSDGSACGTMTGEGDCCESQPTPGCEDADVQECTCDLDAFCCNSQWDDVCVGKAQMSCGLSCGGDEDCCTAHTSPGCDDATLEACVCAADPFCCGNDDDGVGVWDGMCVDRVGDALCGPACTPDDADGPCCEAHGGGGCEIDAVEECVCAEDPMCCQASPGWDSFCVDEIGTFDCGTCP